MTHGGTSGRSCSSALFGTFLSQWTTFLTHLESGSRNPQQLSSSFEGVWSGSGWATTEDYIALLQAAKTCRREWQMSCLLRSRLQSPQPLPPHGPSADGRVDAALGPIAFSLLCWAAALSGNVRWLFTAHLSEIKALVHGECTSAGHPADYRGAAAALALGFFGWFEAVLCVAAQADEAAALSSETDVVAFLERVGTGVVQPAVAIPRPAPQPTHATPALTIITAPAEPFPSKASGDGPASPTTRANARQGQTHRHPNMTPTPPVKGPPLRRSSVQETAPVAASRTEPTDQRRGDGNRTKKVSPSRHAHISAERPRQPQPQPRTTPAFSSSAGVPSNRNSTAQSKRKEKDRRREKDGGLQKASASPPPRGQTAKATASPSAPASGVSRGHRQKGNDGHGNENCVVV